jgi:hypothetical protein
MEGLAGRQEKWQKLIPLRNDRQKNKDNSCRKGSAEAGLDGWLFFLFPEFFVAVVAQQDAGYSALGVVFER